MRKRRPSSGIAYRLIPLIWLPPVLLGFALFLTLKIPAYSSWLFAINMWTFLIFFWDKKLAVQGVQRIPERALFMMIALGGMLGGFIGMKYFRHKTRKMSFYILIGLSLLLHGWFLY